MRWGPKAITALLALACTWGAACGGGGGHDTVTVTALTAFPQGFLPVLAGTGRGDVTLRAEGDLFAVDGSDELIVVSHADGRVVTHDVDDTEDPALLSITPGDDGRLFAGDDEGRIWAISGNGSDEAPFAAGEFANSARTGTTRPITGLAFAPGGFGDFGGQLFAAAGTDGILRISGDPPHADPFRAPLNAPPANCNCNHVDLVFSGTTLLAIDAADHRIVTVSASGEVAPLPSTPDFVKPVGITVDSTASEIYVADAGDDALYTVPASGGARTKRATYDFDGTKPSGLAYDGVGAIAFITADPPAIRGSNLPRIDPNLGLVFTAPTVGYGDLEFDRSGAFILVANDADSGVAGDSKNNFLFRVSRDASGATTLKSEVGPPSTPIEELLGVAVDPFNQVIYFSTGSGNVWKRDAAGIVSRLINVSGSALLGLELVPLKTLDPPFQFDPHGSTRDPSDPSKVDVKLVATTSDGHVFVIDARSETKTQITTTPIGSHLADLVFAADGKLYVVDNKVDNNANSSRILQVTPNGTATVLAPASTQLGRPDGIEIDEGGNRLLVTSQTTGGDQLLAVDLDTGGVTPLRDISIDDGFLPTGVVYDRLGTAVVRERDDKTSLCARSVLPGNNPNSNPLCKITP